MAAYIETVGDLTEKQWVVFRVSQLHNLRRTARDLAHYGRTLTAHLTAAQNNGLAVAVDEVSADGPHDTLAVRATVSVVPGVAKVRGEHDALCISVWPTVSVTKPRARPRLPKLCAVLYSAGSYADEPRNGDDDDDDDDDDDLVGRRDRFCSLPTMLMKGTARLNRAVCLWLSGEFDCCIAPLRLPPVELAWMAAMWSVTDAVADRPLELVYTTPDGDADAGAALRSVRVRVEPDSVSSLWGSLKILLQRRGPELAKTRSTARWRQPLPEDGMDAGDRDEEVGEAMMEALHAHLERLFGLDVRALRLVSVGTNRATVGCDGKLRIASQNDVGGVQAVLQHINDICLTY